MILQRAVRGHDGTSVERAAAAALLDDRVLPAREFDADSTHPPPTARTDAGRAEAARRIITIHQAELQV